MEYEGNRPIRVLFPHELESYSLTGNGDFPRISKAEIQEQGRCHLERCRHSSTGWFVIQCIARGVQGLPITELELITGAFAVLNIVIYPLWWEKPLNVQRGVRVYKKRTVRKCISTCAPKSNGCFDIPIIHRFQLRLPVDPISLTSSTRRSQFVSSCGHSSSPFTFCFLAMAGIARYSRRGSTRFILTSGTRRR